MTANENSTLITGGAGFIGVNLVSSLAEGRAVRVLDDHSNPSPTNPGGARAEKVSGSILDGKALASALSGV
ncbi:MAG: NAD-dependent epimerase/dehydratase family protein, partial [Nitrosospira sp.]|nr:NAD-dependent epimerase/dehydratase family protein [Nitrosospira sp.]